jgi:hypothetical protein
MEDMQKEKKKSGQRYKSTTCWNREKNGEGFVIR